MVPYRGCAAVRAQVAAGNPKQIMEVLEPVLNGYKKSSAYATFKELAK